MLEVYSNFYRASIWWKYFDPNTALPPPFTFIFILHSWVKMLCGKSKINHKETEEEERSVVEQKAEFSKKYRNLLLKLLHNIDHSEM